MCSTIFSAFFPQAANVSASFSANTTRVSQMFPQVFLREHDMCFHNVFHKRDQSFHICFRKFFCKDDRLSANISASLPANKCPIGDQICGIPFWSGPESCGKTCPFRTQICGKNCSVQTPNLWKTVLVQSRKLWKTVPEIVETALCTTTCKNLYKLLI